jgi:capsular polysaccharide biosynthesis protein
MPTLLRWRGYRFFFWSGDRAEPPHVHVKKGSAEAKVWLDPVRLHVAVGLRGHELNTVVRTVHEQRDVFLRAWHDHFGD